MGERFELLQLYFILVVSSLMPCELPRQANLAASHGNGSFQRHTEDESDFLGGGEKKKKIPHAPDPSSDARQEIKQ